MLHEGGGPKTHLGGPCATVLEQSDEESWMEMVHE